MIRPSLRALLLLSATAASAALDCDLTLTACPSQLLQGVLAVPPEVISLDARIPYCQESGRITSSASPSIQFILDHSGRMAETDPDHACFTVVTTLLDANFSTTPKARVGPSNFSNRLAFDTRDNAFFKPLFPGDNGQHDAFAPLTPLDTVFAAGRRRVDTPTYTLFSYALTVQRVPGAVLPPNVVKTCRDQAELAFHAGGQPIAVV